MKKFFRNLAAASILLAASCSSAPELGRLRLTFKSETIQQEIERVKRNYDVRQADGIDYVVFSENKTPDSIIYLNGLETNSLWFKDVAEKLSCYDVYALDRRGSGLNADKKGTGRQWIEDISKLEQIIISENPETDITIIANCYCARTALNSLIQNPEKINSIIVLVPGIYMKVDLNLWEKLSIATSGITGGKTRSPITRDEMFTKNPYYLKFIGDDWLRLRRIRNTDYFEGHLLAEDVKNNLRKIEATNIPILIMLAGKDEIVNSEETKKHFGKLKNVTIIEYPDSKHMLYFDEQDRFVRDTNWWIDSH